MPFHAHMMPIPMVVLVLDVDEGILWMRVKTNCFALILLWLHHRLYIYRSEVEGRCATAFDDFAFPWRLSLACWSTC